MLLLWIKPLICWSPRLNHYTFRTVQPFLLYAIYSNSNTLFNMIKYQIRLFFCLSNWNIQRPRQVTLNCYVITKFSIARLHFIYTQRPGDICISDFLNPRGWCAGETLCTLTRYTSAGNILMVWSSKSWVTAGNLSHIRRHKYTE